LLSARIGKQESGGYHVPAPPSSDRKIREPPKVGRAPKKAGKEQISPRSADINKARRATKVGKKLSGEEMDAEAGNKYRAAAKLGRKRRAESSASERGGAA
jgi:hypothetical protein